MFCDFHYQNYIFSYIFDNLKFLQVLGYRQGFKKWLGYTAYSIEMSVAIYLKKKEKKNH